MKSLHDSESTEKADDWFSWLHEPWTSHLVRTEGPSAPGSCSVRLNMLSLPSWHLLYCFLSSWCFTFCTSVDIHVTLSWFESPNQTANTEQSKNRRCHEENGVSVTWCTLFCSFFVQIFNKTTLKWNNYGWAFWEQRSRHNRFYFNQL